MNIQPLDQPLADVRGTGHRIEYTAFPVRDERLNSFGFTVCKVHTFTRNMLCECHKEKPTLSSSWSGVSDKFTPVLIGDTRVKITIRLGVPPRLTDKRTEAEGVIRILAVHNRRYMLAELLLPGDAAVRFRVDLQKICNYWFKKLYDTFINLGYVFWQGIADTYEHSPEETRTKVLEYARRPDHVDDALATPRSVTDLKGPFRYVINRCSYSSDTAVADAREIARICGHPGTDAGVVRKLTADVPSCLTTQLRVTKACGTFALEDARKDPGIIGITAEELEAAIKRGGKIQNPDIDSNVLCCNGKHYMQLMSTEIVPRAVEHVREALASVDGIELVDNDIS